MVGRFRNAGNITVYDLVLDTNETPKAKKNTYMNLISTTRFGNTSKETVETVEILTANTPNNYSNYS